jgi:hypothetical protein
MSTEKPTAIAMPSKLGNLCWYTALRAHAGMPHTRRLAGAVTETPSTLPLTAARAA